MTINNCKLTTGYHYNDEDRYVHIQIHDLTIEIPLEGGTFTLKMDITEGQKKALEQASQLGASISKT